MSHQFEHVDDLKLDDPLRSLTMDDEYFESYQDTVHHSNNHNNQAFTAPTSVQTSEAAVSRRKPHKYKVTPEMSRRASSTSNVLLADQTIPPSSNAAWDQTRRASSSAEELLPLGRSAENNIQMRNISTWRSNKNDPTSPVFGPTTDTNADDEVMEEMTLILRQSKAAEIHNSFIRGLYLLMEDPSSSLTAWWFNILVALMIILNAIVMSVETLEQVKLPQHVMPWFIVDSTFIGWFAFELTLRFMAHCYSWRALFQFVRSPLTIIDLMSVAPYIAELILFGHAQFESQRFSVLRLFRLFRLFRVFKYSSMFQLSLEVMMIAFKKSADALGAMLLFSAISSVALGTLIYFSERGTYNVERRAFTDSQGELSEFGSIPASIWFTFATITTTGYGDMIPKTAAGRLVAFVSMLVGILLIALPSIIVGRNYIAVWETMKKYRKPTAHLSNAMESSRRDKYSSEYDGDDTHTRLPPRIATLRAESLHDNPGDSPLTRIQKETLPRFADAQNQPSDSDKINRLEDLCQRYESQLAEFKTLMDSKAVYTKVHRSSESLNASKRPHRRQKSTSASLKTRSEEID